MIIKRKNKLIIILFIIISSLIFYPMHSLGYKINDKKYKTINYNDLINTGINQNNNVKDLINWFNSNDKIDFSINIKGSITIKFIDGTYKIILNNPFTLHKTKFNL